MVEARDKLKAVIHKNGGHCVEQERSAEIYFQSRERAQEFYALLRQYRCIVKLKIHLGWKDLVDNDLWELVDVLTVGNVGDVTLDCCFERGEEEEEDNLMAAMRMKHRQQQQEEQRQQHQKMQQQQQQPQQQQQQEPRSSLSYKPLFGLIFSPSLISFTLENFTGSMPALTRSNFSSSVNNAFSIQAYREAAEIVLPTSNNLRILTLTRCGPESRSDYILELFRHSPNLSEIQVDCEVIDTALPMIAEVTKGYDKVTYLKLTESPLENADLYFGKSNSGGSKHMDYCDENGAGSIIQLINRMTLRPPSLNLRACGVCENLTTCCFMDIWDKHQDTYATLLRNNPRIMSMELMCETATMDRMWRFLMRHYYYNQQLFHDKKRLPPGSEPQEPTLNTLTFPPIPPEELAALDEADIRTLKAEVPDGKKAPFIRLRLNDHACSLMAVSPDQNALVLQSYTPQHRLLLQSVEDITKVLCIGSSFENVEELALLRMHLEEDGALLKFDHLTWILSPKQMEDMEFLDHLRYLITARKQYRSNSMRRGNKGEDFEDGGYGDSMSGDDGKETIRFTIRVYAPLFDTRGLIRVWNRVVDTAWLSEEEHGRWMQSCLEHEQNEMADNSVNCSRHGTHPGSFVIASEIRAARKILDKDALPSSGPFSAASIALPQTVIRNLPEHGMTQCYVLPLDERRELTFSSSHLFTSTSVGAGSVATGNSTALTYSLCIASTY